ncbi:MAG: GNAT family N-acetyltransferase [Limisphaerales bacterium]
MNPSETNAMGQPLGRRLVGWKPVPRPEHRVFEGRFCRLEPLDPARHAADLFSANAEDSEGRMWTYLPYGPFVDWNDYLHWVESVAKSEDPLFFAIVDPGKERAIGVAAYLRIDPANGSVEVGHLGYSPRLQRTPAATEAMARMMRHAFDLGYRRYEWKCDALNAPSRAAAERLGFRFEGVFRQAAVVKGRSRDTVWYSILDSEWPAVASALEAWLAPSNFDDSGRQKVPLRRWMSDAGARCGPEPGSPG